MDLNTFQHKLEPGLFLVSKPEAGDPHFYTSVSLLCHHDETGSFALTLNHPTDLYIDIEDFSVGPEPTNDSSFPLSSGGPVGLQQCTFLIKSPKPLSDRLTLVLPEVYLGTDTEALEECKKQIQLTPNNTRFFLGYAGWSYFQLDCEVSNGWWLSHPGDSEVIFPAPQENLWLKILADMGQDFLTAGIHFIDNHKDDS